MLFSMVQSYDNCLVMRRGACASKLRPLCTKIAPQKKKLRKHSGEPGMLDYSRWGADGDGRYGNGISLSKSRGKGDKLTRKPIVSHEDDGLTNTTTREIYWSKKNSLLKRISAIRFVMKREIALAVGHVRTILRYVNFTETNLSVPTTWHFVSFHSSAVLFPFDEGWWTTWYIVEFCCCEPEWARRKCIRLSWYYGDNILFLRDRTTAVLSLERISIEVFQTIISVLRIFNICPSCWSSFDLPRRFTDRTYVRT